MTRRASVSDYVSLARPSHWIKHIFIVPGVVLAVLLQEQTTTVAWVPIVLGFVSASLLASANYVLNEWLDQHSDRYHPEKRDRPAASMQTSRTIVMLEYIGLLVLGGVLALQVSAMFAWTSVLFVFAGIAYNVPPLRTKDHAYLDVITESFNNPLRLTLGWAMVETNALPPSSLLVGYWMGGAFLMTVKRLAEFRTVVAIAGHDDLYRYRRSFRGYSEKTLLVSALLYSLLSSFFIGIFVLKYRIEYLLAVPVLALLFSVYFMLGLEDRSAAQAPERLFRETRLLAIAGALFALLVFLTWVDVPALHKLMEPYFIELDSLRGN